MKAMVEARMSEKEVAYRFGRSRDTIKKMLRGEVKADPYFIQRVRGLSRD